MPPKTKLITKLYGIDQIVNKVLSTFVVFGPKVLIFNYIYIKTIF
jgi:hypothetical protein